MVATKTDGIITYVGFDSANNGKRWIKEKGRWTYVTRQKNEWTQEYIPIVAYDVEYLKEAKRCRYVMPPYSIEKRIMNGETAYNFWKGKDYWFFDKKEAVQFIYDSWNDKG